VTAPPIPSAPADLELIAQLESKLQYAKLRIRVLEEQLRLLRIEKYGAAGERLSQAQLELFEFKPAVNEGPVHGESERPRVHRSAKRRCRHPGRQVLPSNLPRVERILPCTPDQRLCKRCGKEAVVIGYEESFQLDVEPAKYFVLITKREKRACRSCEELGVVAASLPPRIIEKCLASNRIVIDTVVSKYCNHTPLYRQSVILERDIGLEISRATLDGWVLKVGELLIPMVAVMRQVLISGTYIQADETPVDVQTHEAGVRTTKHTAGNTVGQEEPWCSTSVWVGDGMGPGSFLGSSTAFYKQMATPPTIRSAGQEWYMQRVGLMLEDSFSRRSS
jgi:transposase